jgi:hypothetical protein
MKLITKILVAVLIITAIVPIKMGTLCLFQQAQALEFFNLLQLSSDVEKLLVVLGCFIMATVIFQILAIVWLVRGNTEGFSLSAVVGIISIGRGVMMCILLQNSTHIRMSAIPMVFGSIILVLALIAARQQKLVED